MISSSSSPASRSAAIAGTTASRKCLACFSADAAALVLERLLQLVGALLELVDQLGQPSSIFLPSTDLPPAAFTAATLCATCFWYSNAAGRM